MAKKDMRAIEKWWNDASGYYQEELGHYAPNDIIYGPFGSTEKKLKLLGSVKGKRVLELGCGGGQASIYLAKLGAKCTGIDISRRQIEYARKLAAEEGVEVDFSESTMTDLRRLYGADYDIVISIFAIQYIEDLDGLFKEVGKVIRPGGVFLFSTEHPFYLITDPETMQVGESYYKTGRFEEKEKWPDGSRHVHIMYRRKVSDIYNSLFSSGFAVEKTVEPLDMDDRVFGHGYRRKLVRRIGPTMIFKCRPVGPNY